VPELSPRPAKRVHLFVSGQVQGVFFRMETAGRARKLGLGGFVRNLRDGRVEAVFEGDPEVVDAMVEWCHSGPPLANVESVEVIDEEPMGDTDFRTRH
jgi:acylphosphatase